MCNPYKEKIKFITIVKKTGITSDYANEFISCRAILIKYEDKDGSKKIDPKNVHEKIKKYYPNSFMKYTQRGKYKAAQKSKEQFGYKDRIINALKRHKQKRAYSVTRKNKRQVMCLDRIVDELNDMLEDPSKFNCDRAMTLTDRAYVLIYGERKTGIYLSKD